MKTKKEIMVILAGLFFWITLAAEVHAEVRDPNVYVPTDPNVACWFDEPLGPPCWIALDMAGAKAMNPITIKPGGIWVGAVKNNPDPGRTKFITAILDGKNLDRLECVSVTSRGGLEDTILSQGLIEWGDGSESYIVRTRFKKQPKKEKLTFKNIAQPGQNAVVTDIRLFTSMCCTPSGIDVEYSISNTQIGLPGEVLSISDIMIFHEQEEVETFGASLNVQDAGASTWTQEYITEKPPDKEPRPQGGWRWTLISGKSIDYDTLFDLTITMKQCNPGGYYQLYVYDEVKGRWIDFLMPDVSEHRPEDIDGNCTVDLSDLSSMSQEWLQ